MDDQILRFEVLSICLAYTEDEYSWTYHRLYVDDKYYRQRYNRFLLSYSHSTLLETSGIVPQSAHSQLVSEYRDAIAFLLNRAEQLSRST